MKMKKEMIARITVIFLVTVGVVFWGLTFFFNNGIKSRATGETMTYSFVPASVTATANQEFHAMIKVKSTTEAALMARGYELITTFDKAKLELKKIEYKLGSVSQGIGQTEPDLTEINIQGRIRLVGEITAANGLPITNSTDVELVDLTFKYTGTGETTVSIDNNTAIVYWYKTDGTLIDVPGAATTTLDINGGGTDPTATPDPSVPTATPGPSATPDPSIPTVTPRPSGNAKLKMKLKFQGIAGQPADALNKMAVKVKLLNESTKVMTDSRLADFTSDDKGVWSGEVSFDVSTSAKYVVYVKGPFHIQKKICDKTPTETAGGTYKCSNGLITFTAGDNILDFSGIILLAGDLPEQDSTVSAYDTSLVRNCLAPPTPEQKQICLIKADVNRDGGVDTQDYSLIIASLSVKNDEE